nr:molybdopterin dinucleotide binding domain-containing protein [Gordonibacter sp. 28C]
MAETASNNTQPDLEEGEYVLFMGAFPGSNGKSFQGIAKRTLERLKTGECTIDVVDPVLGNGCVTPTIEGINWIPIKTATNAAFALGIVRKILEDKTYDAAFLSYPNYQSAFAGGFASYTNASHLVIVDESHPNYRKLMRASDAGLEEPPADPKATTPVPYYVVIDQATGQPAIHTQSDAAQFEYEGEVNGVKVRSSFLFLKDNAYEHTMDEYAEITGTSVATMERIAKEFVSHGTKASARLGFGGSATANGTTGVLAYPALNGLIGSAQMTGGCNCYRIGSKTTTDGDRYKLATIKGKPTVSAKNATYICRTQKLFSQTDEYKARVAAGEKDPKPKLPWLNVPSTSDNQALVSIVNEYPYQAKILVSWMTNTIQATSGALRDSVIEKLKDTSVVPLHIACDAFIGEHAQLADYIVPDTTPFESFGLVTQEGYWRGKGNTVRWQAKQPSTVELSDGRFASFEAFCVDVAKACDMPGFGDNAIEATDGTVYPLNDAADFFLKAVANLAFAEEPVADVSAEDVKLQALDELPAAWKDAVTDEEWPKVLNVLSRGGRFWPIETSQKNGRSAYAKEYLIQYYSEKKALNKNPYSGAFPDAALRYVPEDFCDRTPIAEVYSEQEWPFRSTNYKPRFRSISMQANSPIMRDLCEKNYLEISLDDAAALGIKDGDTVSITNPTGDVMKGEAMVRAGIARGTFGVAYGYGHHAYGAQDTEVDGTLTKGDPAIGSGVHLQTMLDPTLEDGVIYPHVDSDAGSPGRSGGMYKIEKA